MTAFAPLFKRYQKGERLTHKFVNAHSEAIESNAREVGRLSDELVQLKDADPEEDGAGGISAGTWTFTETGRTESSVTVTDDNGDEFTLDVATQITLTATINGQAVTLVLNFASP